MEVKAYFPTRNGSRREGISSNIYVICGNDKPLGPYPNFALLGPQGAVVGQTNARVGNECY
jgi:hypothetical protein